MILGSTTPRVWTKPLVTGPPGPCGCGCALTPETSKGFELVQFAETVLGMRLQPWQRWLSIHALELRDPEPGEYLTGPPYRYRTILVLVARQNGKTTWIEVKNLWRMFMYPNVLVVSTAQDLETSEASWGRGCEIVEDENLPELGDEVLRIDKTNGKKALKLVNGSAWKVVASTRRGGRGASGDDLNLDEIREHLDFQAWSAISKTMNARASGQLFATSNAGDDRSIVLNVLHASARAVVKDPARDPTIGLFEWSVSSRVRCDCGRRDPNPADPDDEPEPHAATCMLNDPALWAQANPNMNRQYGQHERSIRSQLNIDPVHVFLTEVLCQRVPTLAPRWQVVTEAVWRRQGAPGLRPVNVAFCAQVSHDRKRTVIAAAGEHPDRPGHLLLAVVENREGTAWAPARLHELVTRWDPVAVALQDKGPTGALQADIEGAEFVDRTGRRVKIVQPPADKDRPRRGDLIVPWASDVGDAYGQLVDGLAEGTYWHSGDGPLTSAMQLALTRPISGATTWDAAKIPGGELIEAVTLAAWAHGVRAPMVVSTYDPLANIG